MSAVAALGVGYAREAAGPAIQQSLSSFRAAVGYNDLASGRAVTYEQNYLSTSPNAPGISVPAAQNDYHTTFRLSYAQALEVFNRRDWEHATAQQRVDWWYNLQLAARWNGIAMSLPDGVPPNPAQSAVIGYDADHYRTLALHSSTPAPLDSVIRAYYRSMVGDPFEAEKAEKELSFAWRRAAMRRIEDRENVLRPWYHWSANDAIRLGWLKALDADKVEAIKAAAGIRRAQDANVLDWLNVQLPGSDQLAAWAQRSLWDEGIADRYGLDERFDVASVAMFFARAQGAGVSPGNLPDQPDGEADWQKLTQRAATPVIGLREAFELQHRFRPAADGSGDSVVAGVPAWTADNTVDAMSMAGISTKQQEWLIGLATEPLNVRIIQTVLVEALKHPAIAAQAQADFGPGVDWVLSAYLDHGFSPQVAALAAAGVRAKAQDEADAELLESQKQLRAEHRAITLKRYAAGLLVTGDAVTQLTGDQYTAAMALEALTDVDYEIGLTLLDSAVKSIREAYLAGQITIDQAAAQLTVLGVLEARRINYVQQWTWERSAKVRTLSTGEILAALKQGLLTPAVALQRLENLGWTAPDAIIEVALAEQELAAAQARAAASAAAKAATASQAAVRRSQLEARQEAAQAEKVAARAKKQALLATLAPAEEVELRNKYVAQVLADGSAWWTAEQKGNQAGQAAALAEAIAQYDAWLVDQQRLRDQEVELGAPISPPETGQLAVPEQGAGTGGAASPAAPSGSGAGAADTGTTPPPGS